jgi:aspartate carbamoyltransferase catalytic subunit
MCSRYREGEAHLNRLVSMEDLSDHALRAIFDLAEAFSRRLGRPPAENRALANEFLSRLGVADPCEPDRILATLFFEPSTRTRLSFESAMHRLGGRVLGFADARTSSTMKGETLADTIRMVNGYADAIVMRHPSEGSALLASWFAQVPLINAGDGGREHPTQCLLDLFTLRRELGRIEGLKVGLCGDLRNGRTVHSLAQGLARFGAEPICIAPEILRMPEAIMAFVERATGRRPREVERPEEVLPELDALYVTRVQGERFDDPAAYEAVKGIYVVDPALMEGASASCIVLHPLPRVDEISPSFDRDPRAAYFRQGHNGVPVRMALIALMLSHPQFSVGGPPRPAAPGEALPAGVVCENTRCVSRSERHVAPWLERDARGALLCGYCHRKQQQGELPLA